jgi:predicted nucleic acid-binding Zn ribbon protein
MPLLEFKCEENHITERLYAPYKAALIRSRETTIPCGECGKAARLEVSLPAPAQFTGSGFYATDYKGK